jgi:hypothetical protein
MTQPRRCSSVFLLLRGREKFPSYPSVLLTSFLTFTMASSDSPDQHALDALRSPGFHFVQDPEVGKHASEPFEDIDTEVGLRFYMQNFQNDTRISAILKSLLGSYQLVAYRTFTPDTTRIFQFRRGGKEAGCILIVLLWPPDSNVIYYGDSLQHHLFAVDSDNGLWRVPKAAANRAGCGEGKPIELEHGGL